MKEEEVKKAEKKSRAIYKRTDVSKLHFTPVCLKVAQTIVYQQFIKSRVVKQSSVNFKLQLIVERETTLLRPYTNFKTRTHEKFSNHRRL